MCESDDLIKIQFTIKSHMHDVLYQKSVTILKNNM